MARRNMVRSILRLSALLGALAATGVQAQDPSQNPTLAADWIISGGTAFTHNDPKIGLAPEGERVSLIDLDTLGVDADDNDFSFSLAWQGPERWRLAFTTYASAVDGGLFTDKDYEFGDLDIPAGSGLAIDTKARFYIVNAHYSIWQKPRWEAGIGFGIYGLDWEGSIALVEGGRGEIVERETSDFIAPLPTVALFGRYAFTERLAGYAGIDWLSVNISDYDGEVLALSGGLDWWFSKRWGLSAGVNLVDIDVAVDDEPFNEYVDANWESLFLKLRLAF